MKETRILHISQEIEDNPIGPRRIELSELGLPLDRAGRISWRQISEESIETRKQMIETAGRHLVAAGINLSQKGMAQAHLSGFYVGIKRMYPGGSIGLRENLGFRESQKPNNYWKDPDVIEQEALKLLELGFDISYKTSTQVNAAGLNHAIYKYYPGGMVGLREKLGMEITKRPKGYWTTGEIELQARDFLSSSEKLTQQQLCEKGRSDLAAAITRFYPNGFYGLQKTLGLTVTKVPNNYWTKERIEDEVAGLLEKIETLNYNSLREHERHDLVIAILYQYPGKIRSLREHFGLQPELRRPSGFWNIENIEAVSRKIVQSGGILTSKWMEENKLSSLAFAIKKKYPGGIKSLRKNLGVELQSRKGVFSTNQANAWLEDLLIE